MANRPFVFGASASLVVRPDQGAVLIALHLRDKALEADVTILAGAARTAQYLIAGQPVTVEAGGKLKLVFQPCESRVLWLRE